MTSSATIAEPLSVKRAAWQTAFLDCLGESVHEVLRSLREVPLDVAAQSRVVIEDAQRDRAQPLAAGVSTFFDPWWKSRCHRAPTYSAS